MAYHPRYRHKTKQASTSLVLGSLFFLISHGIPAAPTQAAAAQGTYFVCTYATSTAGAPTYYVSAVNGVPPGAEPGPFLGQLAPAFGHFVTTRYKVPVGVGSYNCVYQFSQANAEALRQRDLTTAAPKGYNVVDTGWKYGDAAPAATAAPVPPTQPAATAVVATAPGPATAPAPPVQAPAVTTTIAMRLVDTILSASDQPGRQYRAVVTQATSAGSVSIPVNTEARIALAQSAGAWSAQLTSLSLNGQTVTVTSSSVSATSPIQQAEQSVQKLRGLLGGLGGLGKNDPAHASVNEAIAAGPRVVLPAGTALTFTASVPQPMRQSSLGGSGPSAATAATGTAPIVASTASQGNVAAAQTGGGPAGMCEFTVPGKYYYSAIFDVPNEDNKDKWEVAWAYYINKHVDPFPGNGGCVFYRTRAGAQHDLQVHKSMVGAKLIETGWVYTGPDQLPPPPVPHPGNVTK